MAALGGHENHHSAERQTSNTVTASAYMQSNLRHQQPQSSCIEPTSSILKSPQMPPAIQRASVLISDSGHASRNRNSPVRNMS